MRGKRGDPLPNPQYKGITPAHAGKTTDHLFSLPSSKDHPRACGENSILLSSAPKKAGSPPRMRGKHFINA